MEMNWTALGIIVAISMIIETLTENVKTRFPAFANTDWAVMAVTVVLGVSIALNYNADIFAAAGLVGRVPWLGVVLTGVLMAGGSNLIFDAIKKLRGVKSALDASQGISGDESVSQSAEEDDYVG
ncbi:MAG: hypothetical protein Q4B42_00930 [Oscillospiraceae bacterium]|nr:hypothetical protein [Oscillospiraceae bacterium]